MIERPNTLRVPLHAIAHGRAGDKGDTSNISVIAYRAEAWPLIRDEVTEARVHQVFAPLGATSVKRYMLENLRALNFVIEDTLGGGVNASLAIDRHGKALSFRLLGAIELKVMRDMLPDGSPYLSQ
ncbi:MAG: hypothetical protein OEN23_12325 [Paracoccaceae bacterium]|nr:hypothetical protein [Paracoccaceae bacterium]